MGENPSDDRRIEGRFAALQPEKRVKADSARLGQRFEREAPASAQIANPCAQGRFFDVREGQKTSCDGFFNR